VRVGRGIQIKRFRCQAGGLYRIQREPDLRILSVYRLPNPSADAQMSEWEVHLCVVLDTPRGLGLRTELVPSIYPFFLGWDLVLLTDG
jgi:hypothetical protein